MRRSIAFAALGLLSLACCFGGPGSSGSVTHRLDPMGITIELASTHTGGPSGNGYLFTSGDRSSTVEVTMGEPGSAAAGPTSILPGALANVQWTRATTYGGSMPGTESRVIEVSPHARTHWIGSVEGPNGTVWIHLSTDTSWVPGPTDGDLGWTTLRDSVRRAP